MGLFKRCGHKTKNRDRCDDPWWGSYRGHRVSLAKWADQDVPSKTEAQTVLEAFKQAVREAMRAGLDGKALKARLGAGLHAQHGKAQPMAFKDFADLYLERHVKGNALKSADTITYRMEAMKVHFGDRALSDIRTADVEDFLAGLRRPAKFGRDHSLERVRKPSTVNRYRSQLVQMFNWALMRDYVERTPFAKAGSRGTLVKAAREDNKRTRRLSVDEEKRLLEHASPPLRILITVALYTGMRRGEMLSLTWSDLDARSGWIRLRGDTTKSGRTRWVPVLPTVQAMFDFLATDANGDRKPAEGPVFSNEVGEPVRNFRTAWKATLERARITDYRWHDLRHEYASRLAERGVPLVQVQELLGHASIVTTERYNTNRLEQLKASVQVLKENGKSDDAKAGGDQKSYPAPDGLSQSLHSSDGALTDPTNTPKIS
jgi:integrase